MGHLDIRQTLTSALLEPRKAFQQVEATGLTRTTLWQVVALMTVLRVLLVASVGGGVMTIPLAETTMDVTPLGYALALGAGAVIQVFLFFYVGRALDGRGTFDGALIAVALLEALSVSLVLVQLVLGWISLTVASYAGLIGVIALFVCTLVYVDEMHQFGSLWKAFGALLLGIVGLTIGVSVLLVLIGVGNQF